MDLVGLDLELGNCTEKFDMKMRNNLVLVIRLAFEEQWYWYLSVKFEVEAINYGSLKLTPSGHASLMMKVGQSTFPNIKLAYFVLYQT